MSMPPPYLTRVRTTLQFPLAAARWSAVASSRPLAFTWAWFDRSSFTLSSSPASAAKWRRDRPLTQDTCLTTACRWSGSDGKASARFCAAAAAEKSASVLPGSLLPQALLDGCSLRSPREPSSSPTPAGRSAPHLTSTSTRPSQGLPSVPPPSNARVASSIGPQPVNGFQHSQSPNQRSPCTDTHRHTTALRTKALLCTALPQRQSTDTGQANSRLKATTDSRQCSS
mmetsp:Transcript_38445/g.108646  ORF Transcript_38445/g.108646 Transcript_38445/m.108646 type:complete len:227 (+) Transcript_38445:2545-3225(+)